LSKTTLGHELRIFCRLC